MNLVLDHIRALSNDITKLNTLTIELLSGCNLCCVHCYVENREMSESSSILSYEQVKKLLDQAESLGVFSIIITGGEPLIHPQIYDILEYASNKNFLVTLRTNATLINDNNIEILKKFTNGIVVSVYGFSHSNYDASTGVKGSFSMYSNGLSLLDKNGVKYELRGILLRENEDEADEFIKSCSMIETYITYHKNNQYSANHCPSDEVIYKMYKHSYHKDYKLKSISSDSVVCSLCTGALTVNSQGEYNPCTNFPLYMGHIDERAISDVWNSNERVELIEKSKFINCKKCSTCDLREYSFKLSLCNNFVETGDMTSVSDASCKHCKLIKKAIDENSK